MKAAFTRVLLGVRFAGTALALLTVFDSSAIPPRNHSINSPWVINGETLVGDESQTIEQQFIVQSLNAELMEATVVAAKAGPWLGIGSAEASDALDAQLGLPRGEGLVVVVVVTNSPAEKAGLQKNDVLVEFEGQRLVHPAQFRKLLQMKAEGEKVKLTFFRGGKKQVVSAKLEMPPADSLFPGERSEGKKVEMQGHGGSERALKDVTAIVVPTNTALRPKHGVQVAKATPTPRGMSYMQRQGWRADFRTLVAMAKWLIAPEPAMNNNPAANEPITTSITEVVHGRNLGNI